MPRPRNSLISLSETSYYHCVSRCVRRAYLCGKDLFSGQCYEHRRQWVEDRLLRLAKVFAIDLCAYAVMSNHTHVVLHIDKDRALSWSIDEVLSRWHTFHRGTVLTRRYVNASGRETMTEIEVKAVESIANVYRERLYNISWFMRLLNEYIARLANKEDKCTGRFWEGRFKSQALLDETSLAACMAYVDLNPIRAKIAQTPENSSHTSIRKRVIAAKRGTQPKLLKPFVGTTKQNKSNGLPYRLEDYINLVEETGRRIHPDKKGNITHPSTIFARAGLTAVDWSELVFSIETQFSTSISIEIFKTKRKRDVRQSTG